MKVEVTEQGPCRRQVTIEVEPEVVEERVAERVREYRRTRTIPGFRPGRATETLIRRRYGKQIRADVVKELIPELWDRAVEEQGLQPVSRPEFDQIDDAPGQPLKIVGVVEVKPQIEIRNYKGIKVTREVQKVTDEDVERQIELMRQERADELPVDRPAQMGDVVVATVQMLDASGVPLVGRREERRRWQLGGIGSVSAEMDEQLCGMTPGQTKRVTFHYREDFFDQARAGQEDRAEIAIHEIYERQVPELDDEFAKDIGDFETVDDLKKAVRESLERRARQIARRQVHRQLRDRIVQENQFDVPESLVERYLESLFREHLRQGHVHDREEFQKEHRTEAINEVRAMLALEQIARQENLTISDEQVDEHIRQMAASMGMAFDELRDAMRRSSRYESLRADLLEEAVLDFLEEHAKVEEVEISGESKIVRT